MMQCNLMTYFDGALTGEGPIWLLLHERYGDLEQARALGARFGDDVLRVAVQSARMQTEGGLGHVRGHFWHIGPLEGPELSTFGDGLAELDALVQQLQARFPGRALNILGQGESAGLAMVLGLIYADVVDEVLAIDARWPQNFAQMPVTVPQSPRVRFRFEGEIDPAAEPALAAILAAV